MGHAVHIQSREQHIQALRVLDKVGGTWQGIGTSDDPILLLTDAQYSALVEAGVIAAVRAGRDGDNERQRLPLG